MDHPLTMGIVESAGDFAGDPERLAKGKLSLARNPLAEGLLLGVRHDVVQARDRGIQLEGSRVQQREDVGMLKVCGDLDLVQETLGPDVGGELGREDLERDRPIVLEVARQIDQSHSAVIQTALDRVPAGEDFLESPVRARAGTSFAQRGPAGPAGGRFTRGGLAAGWAGHCCLEHIDTWEMGRPSQAPARSVGWAVRVKPPNANLRAQLSSGHPGGTGRGSDRAAPGRALRVSAMLQHPRLKEDYRTLLCEGRGVLLLSDAGDALLPAGLYEHLLPLLDGLTSTQQLTRHLERDWRPVHVWYALWRLEQLGCVVEAAGDTGTPDALRPGTAGEDPVTTVGPRIALKTLGEVPNGVAADALQACGFELDDSAAFSVVLTDSYLRPELAKLNRDALETGRPWLLARPVGPAIWIGPRFHPHIGCCWRCLGDRLRRNHPHEYRLLGQLHPLLPLGPEWPGSRLFARLLARHINASGPDAILSFAPAGKSLRKHRVPRRPQCPACGDAGLYERLSTLPLLPPVGVAYLAGDEVATLPRFECLVDPLVGVVRDLRRLPSEDGAPLHVYVARYGTDPVNDDRVLSETGLHRGSGKGMTDVEARVSALGEAIERYSGVFQGDEPRFRASLNALGPAAIHPNECMQFSETQYRQRERPDAAAEPTPDVPPPFDPEAPIEWTAARSLSGDDCRYLPTMLLYSGYPLQGQAAYCVPDPSGSAAASSREEALLRGVLELVERDSLALWWYNRVARPGVGLSRCSDAWCESLVAHYRSHGRDLWAIDITSDIGIPTFAALSRRTVAGPERIVLGFGAHLDAAVALRRALAEMDQVLTGIASEERAGALGLTQDRWLREATVANQPYLAPSPAPAVRPDDLPALATNDLARDLALCEAFLARRGLRLLFLDQTRPDIGIPVIKAIVPGLRHFRTRFASGRLYTAPVEAGWLDQPRLESDLNPIGFFL